jgi:biotin carboxyl carrier protein
MVTSPPPGTFCHCESPTGRPFVQVQSEDGMDVGDVLVVIEGS